MFFIKELSLSIFHPSENSLCTLLLRANLLCVAKLYRIRKKKNPKKILIIRDISVTILDILHMEKTGWHKSRGVIKPLPFGGGMGWAGGVPPCQTRTEEEGGVGAAVVPHTRVLFCGGKSNLSEPISLGSKSEVCFILGDWHEIRST